VNAQSCNLRQRIENLAARLDESAASARPLIIKDRSAAHR
jgi:hypothetical protein